MIDHFIQHVIFDFVDLLGFWIYAGVVYGAIWVQERWSRKK